MVTCNKLLEAAWERVHKLKEELATRKKSSETVAQELEARVVEKEALLAGKHAWLVEVEARLVQTEGLLCLTVKKVKVVEKQANFAIAWVVEYKKSKDFENDAA